MNRFTGESDVSNIIQYNITSETIHKASSLSSPTAGGLAPKGKDSKYIYYFGGQSTEKIIHRFNPATEATVKLRTDLLSDVMWAAGVITPDSAFIFNGRIGDIIKFDLTSETVEGIGNLTFESDTVISTATITDSASNKVCLFPASFEKYNNRVKVFKSETRLI
jgi:hypothetical protein